MPGASVQAVRVRTGEWQREQHALEFILSPLLAVGGVRMVAAAEGVGRAWPAVSKAPREAHVATQVGFLASGDEELPAHRQLFRIRSSAARGQPQPRVPGGPGAPGGPGGRGPAAGG